MEDINALELENKRLKASIESHKKNRDVARKELQIVQEKCNRLTQENISLLKNIDRYIDICSRYKNLLEKSKQQTECMIRLNEELTEVNKMLIDKINEYENPNVEFEDEEPESFMDFIMDVIMA